MTQPFHDSQMVNILALVLEIQNSRPMLPRYDSRLLQTINYLAIRDMLQGTVPLILFDFRKNSENLLQIVTKFRAFPDEKELWFIKKYLL